ncbi:MAG: hypothetical protein ACYS47_21590, partial [Planctomycetota bacterium]
MKTEIHHSIRLVISACLAAALAPVAASAAQGRIDPGASRRAAAILKVTGFRGGLIAHVGCGDASLTAALGEGKARLVDGLSRDAREVAAARRTVNALGLGGKVAIVRLRGERMPYIDGLVNLLVVEEAEGVAAEEMMRVLAPRGVAYVKSG